MVGTNTDCQAVTNPHSPQGGQPVSSKERRSMLRQVPRSISCACPTLARYVVGTSQVAFCPPHPPLNQVQKLERFLRSEHRK